MNSYFIDGQGPCEETMTDMLKRTEHLVPKLPTRRQALVETIKKGAVGPLQKELLTALQLSTTTVYYCPRKYTVQDGSEMFCKCCTGESRGLESIGPRE